MKKFLRLVSVVILAFSIGSCSFGHQNYVQTKGPLNGQDNFVVQLDDNGSFWDPEVPARALEAIDKESKTTNTIVVLFIHGWHHNADIDDDNAKDFATNLEKLKKRLDDNVGGTPGIYRSSRERLTNNGDVKVIGIYVGWRGKSLPMPLDYLTFWGRKGAAERVGEGDLQEFLRRLNQVYRDRYTARIVSSKNPFMGMISFGHSFGGQVLFKAVANEFERELIDVTPSIPSDHRTRLVKPILGFGDLTVLVNPALEASQYERIRRLDSRLEYDRQQTPLLLVLSSATDSARKFFFPVGRMINGLFRAPMREGQRALWIEALGEFEPQRTHTIEIVQENNATSSKFDPNIYLNNPCGIVNYDLTNIPIVGGVQLKPIGNQPHRFSPFLVANTSGNVIFHHSGIFTDELRNFLNDYIAITEGKNLLLADPEMVKCPYH
jgi:hypothetical protein